MHWLKKQKLKVKPISKLGGFYLIASLGFAMVSTIWAIYLESFVHNASSVGFLTSLFTATGILAYFLLIPIIEKRNKSSLLLASFLIFIIKIMANESLFHTICSFSTTRMFLIRKLQDTKNDGHLPPVRRRRLVDEVYG